MSRKAGVISIDVTAGTGKMVLDLEKGKGALREFGSSGKASMAPTSAALKELEGNITTNNRAVARFLADTLKLGPVIQSAFPLIGAIAFAGMLGDLGKKVYDFFKSAEEAPQRIGNAFRELNQPLHLANDELRLTNARLAEDIAKLEGHPGDGLKVALAEAVVIADKLAQSIEKSLNELDAVEKKQAIGSLKAFFTGKAGTGGDQAEIEKFSSIIEKIDAVGIASVRAARTKDGARQAEEAWHTKALGALDEEIRKFETLTAETKKYQDIAAGKGPRLTAAQYATHGVGPTPGLTGDASGLLEERSGALERLKALRDQYNLSMEESSSKARKDELTPQVEAARKEQEVRNRLNEEEAASLGSKLDVVEKINAEESVELDRLNKAHELYTGIEDQVKRIYTNKRSTALDEEAQKANEYWKRQGDESFRAAGKMLGIDDEESRKTVETGTKALEERSKALEKLAAQYNKISSESASQGRQHQIRMIGIGGDASDPLGTLAKQQAIQAQDIQDRYNNSLKLANSNLERANALRERNLELQRLQDDKEEAEAQKRKQERDELANPVIGGISAQLADLATGQKTSFGKTFQGVGHQLIQQQMEKGLHSIVEKIFPVADKPHHVIVDNWPGGISSLFGVNMGGGQGGSGGPLGALAGMTGPLGSLGRLLGGVGSVTGDITPAMAAGSEEAVTSAISSLPMLAEGGDVDPGHGYWVGDGGEPEFFSPRTAGTITPRSKMSGGSPTYIIHAPNAELGAYNRIARGMEAMHNSAVHNSVRASAEHAKRTPKRTS